ncbi:MAG: FdtA/QdtA family cupin domain-containing protein [Chloroflexi bacterium]|nr:FdtA/QdtA family cupin domain-containing protein [Chloroflexota bacterium]
MNPALRIRVYRSAVIRLQFFKDLPDGNLFIAESARQIPFPIKRVYFINSLANPEAVRGRHAHKTLEQVLVCICGSFVLHLDDGRTRQRMTLNDPSCGIYMGPLVWHKMTSFSYDCVILVLASDWFAEADYIRDYQAFKTCIQTGPGTLRP